MQDEKRRGYQGRSVARPNLISSALSYNPARSLIGVLEQEW